MAQLMAKCRHKARAIKNMLDDMANAEGMPITWTVDEVYDHFVRLGLGQKAQDAAGLDAQCKSPSAERLLRRPRASTGLVFKSARATGSPPCVAPIPDGTRVVLLRSGAPPRSCRTGAHAGRRLSPLQEPLPGTTVRGQMPLATPAS